MLSCQHIPCADLHGCNISCCRVFRRRVRCVRSLSCTQLCRWSWWTHLSSKLPLLSYLDGLKPYYCNKFSFKTFDLISVWLNSVINPQVLCVSALPIQGWHLATEIWPSEVGSLQDGIRTHTDYRMRPLRKAIGHSSLLISDSSPFFYSINGGPKEQVCSTGWRHTFWTRLEESH